MKVWLVLRYVETTNDEAWTHHVQGVFASRERAIEAMRDDDHCMAEFALDEELPQEATRVDAWTWRHQIRRAP